MLALEMIKEYLDKNPDAEFVIKMGKRVCGPPLGQYMITLLDANLDGEVNTNGDSLFDNFDINVECLLSAAKTLG